jgi:hypothetical protein
VLDGMYIWLSHEDFMLIRRALIQMGNGFVAERLAHKHREEEMLIQSEAIYALIERLMASHTQPDPPPPVNHTLDTFDTFLPD